MEFLMKLNVNSEQIFNELIKFENLPNYLPRQLKDVKILEKSDRYVVTRETLIFKTVVKNEIIQESKHEIEKNQIKTTLISGPAKNSVINIFLKNAEGGCEILIKIDLKLILKARILMPIIKKAYVGLLTGVLYKIEKKIKDGKLND